MNSTIYNDELEILPNKTQFTPEQVEQSFGHEKINENDPELDKDQDANIQQPRLVLESKYSNGNINKKDLNENHGTFQAEDNYDSFIHQSNFAKHPDENVDNMFEVKDNNPIQRNTSAKK